MHTILVLVGSLRAGSINRTFAKALERLAEKRFAFVYADLGSLPHYNDDLWKDPPAAVTAFKAQIEAADGVLFVTPEYNRTVPGVLTNAIFWGVRPWGKSSWPGKPVAVVGTSPGAIGTAVAQSHLRSILPGLEVSLLGQPEVYFQTTPGLIDADFKVTDEKTAAFLSGWLDTFEAHVAKAAAG